MPGHKVKRKLGSDPSDSSGILTVVAVAYAAHRRFDPQTEGLHQPCHGAAGNIAAFTLQLPPDLAHAIDTEVLLDHPLNIWLQGVIPSRSRRQPGRIGAPGGMRMVGRWGDRQHPADRLDPIRPAVIVEEGDHGLCRRSSSARAKYALALRRMSLAWRSSRFSRSSALSLVAISPACARCRARPSSPTHSASATCSLSCSLSRRSLTIATHARARDQPPAAPHAHGPQVKTCSLSCLSSLHLLKSWSLRQTRGGSCCLPPTNYSRSAQRFKSVFC